MHMLLFSPPPQKQTNKQAKKTQNEVHSYDLIVTYFSFFRAERWNMVLTSIGQATVPQPTPQPPPRSPSFHPFYSLHQFLVFIFEAFSSAGDVLASDWLH